VLYIVYQNHDFEPQIKYIFNVIFGTYGVDYKILSQNQLSGAVVDRPYFVISYGKEKPSYSCSAHIHIYESDLFGEHYLQPESMPAIPLKRYNTLPVLYCGNGSLDSFVRESDSLIETNIDIVASSFFMLTRYEEIILGIRDEFGRFPARASLAYKEEFLNRPIVNEYIELLWSWLHSLTPEICREPLWPDSMEFAVCLTHDVDQVSRYSVSRLTLLRPAAKAQATQPLRKKVWWAVSLILDYLRFLLHLEKDPYDTFDYILGLEGKYGFKSSFYFMACRIGTPDMAYSINERKVIDTIHSIEASGCEVGLHGSYDSYDDVSRMAEEKSRLDGVLSTVHYGCRQHYLRWRTPDTWRIQSKSGLLYDTTLTFPDKVGFRCGICLPFKPFDIVENRVIDIWELPTVVMDASFTYPDYQNYSFEEGYSEIIRHINTVKEVNGVFVLLWHNFFHPRAGWMRQKRIFEAVLNYINEQNAWVTNGREIISYFRQQIR